MKIEVLGHAGILLEAGSSKIVMDAWFSPAGAFESSWFQFPQNHHFNQRDWSQITHSVVSHEHLDHLDPQFIKTLPIDVPVCAVHFGTRLFHQKIEHLTGRKPHRVKPEKIIQLGDVEAIVLVEESPMNQDSVWAFRHNGLSVVHTVDSRLNDEQLDQILEFTDGAPDLLLLQCSGASWYPMAYEEIPEQERIEKSQLKREQKLSYALATAEYMNPRGVMICAGPPIFLDPELREFNSDPSFPNPAESEKWFKTKGFSGEVAAPLPGDIVNIENLEWQPDTKMHAEFSWLDCSQYITDYANRMSGQILDTKKAADNIHTECLFEDFKTHFTEMLKLNDYFLDRINMSVCFDVIGDEGGKWLVEFRKGGNVRKCEPNDLYQYKYQLESCWLKRIVIEGLPWEDFFLSLRFTASRNPDLYNDHLLGLLKFNERTSLSAVERYEKKGSDESIVVQTEHGKRYRIAKYCPHAGASLENAPIDGNTITCLLHHYTFDLDSGECFSGNCSLRTELLNDEFKETDTHE